jgi:uncharacterized protein YacL
MVLHILRALFILLMGAVGWFFVRHGGQPLGRNTWLAMTITLSVGVFFLCVDILSPRKKLAIFSGTFLGLLVGLVVAYGMSFVVDMMADRYMERLPDPTMLLTPKEKQDYVTQKEARLALVMLTNMTVGVVCCYLAISFILQTKDDFRFIIPYVEFRKEVRGPRSILVDTSVIIDGRLLDVLETGFIESRLVVPRFVVEELQMIADNGDKLKRNRGKRGLDILRQLQENKRKVEVIIYDWTGHSSPEAEGADQKLLVLGKELNARVLTNDVNLSKVALLRGVEVVNINELASALRPVVLPGERMTVKLMKGGEEASQGVGFLEDGTMVVVKDGRGHLGQDVEFSVTNVLQTSTGRMIFGQLLEPDGRRPARPRGDRQSIG